MDEINPLWGLLEDITIRDYCFQQTCGACPEQYDVFVGDKQVAYVRLRWDRLRVDVPDYGGDTIYVHHFDDDGYKGVFDSEDERIKYLNIIADELDKLK